MGCLPPTFAKQQSTKKGGAIILVKTFPLEHNSINNTILFTRERFSVQEPNAPATHDLLLQPLHETGFRLEIVQPHHCPQNHGCKAFNTQEPTQVAPTRTHDAQHMQASTAAA